MGSKGFSNLLDDTRGSRSLVGPDSAGSIGCCRRTRDSCTFDSSKRPFFPQDSGWKFPRTFGIDQTAIKQTFPCFPE